jgi:MFS family permease
VQQVIKASACPPTKQRMTDRTDRSLFRNTRFRRLWTAITISWLGSQFGVVATSMTAAILLDASAVEMSILAAVTMLPGLLFGLHAGVWADRLPKRTILITGDIVRGTALLFVPILYLADALTMTSLCIISGVVATAMVFYDVTMQAFLPSVVPGKQSMEANAHIETSRSMGLLIGPTLAGFAVSIVKAPFVLLADVFSFVVSVILIWNVRAPETVPAKRTTSMWREIAEGVAFVQRHRALRAVGQCSMVMNFFRVGLTSFLVVFQLRSLHMTEAQIGIVAGLGNIGMVVAGVAVTKMTSRWGVGRTLLIGAICCTLPLPFLAATPAALALPGLLMIQAVHSFGWVVYHSSQIGWRQLVTPVHLRGRMNATMRYYEWGLTPIAAICGGVGAELLGMRATMLIAGIGTVACIPLLLRVARSEIDTAHLQEADGSLEDAFGPGVTTDRPNRVQDADSDRRNQDQVGLLKSTP